jgi:hypothetical protein
VCEQETSKTRRLKPATGAVKIKPQWVVTAGKQTTNKQFHEGEKIRRQLKESTGSTSTLGD